MDKRNLKELENMKKLRMRMKETYKYVELNDILWGEGYNVKDNEEEEGKRYGEGDGNDEGNDGDGEGDLKGVTMGKKKTKN